jgi:hypothetical protein
LKLQKRNSRSHRVGGPDGFAFAPYLGGVEGFAVQSNHLASLVVLMILLGAWSHITLFAADLWGLKACNVSVSESATPSSFT